MDWIKKLLKAAHDTGYTAYLVRRLNGLTVTIAPRYGDIVLASKAGKNGMYVPADEEREAFELTS